MQSEPKFESLPQVREEIDRIDAAIVALLGERSAMVKWVATFKPSADAVRVHEREQFVISRVCQLAEQQQLHPEFVTQLYRLIIDYFSSRQEAMLGQKSEVSIQESEL